VLEDEARVLVQRGLQSGIGMSTSGGSGGAHRLSQFSGSLAEKDIDCAELAVRTRNPILFQPTLDGKPDAIRKRRRRWEQRSGARELYGQCYAEWR